MKQWVKRYLSFFLVLLLCVGCGKVPETPGDSSGAGSGEQSPSIVSSEEGSGRTYRVEQTITIAIEDPDTDFFNKTVYSGAYGSMLYLLAVYQLEGETEPAMWIYTFDLNTQETEKASFSLETPGMENPRVDSMTVTGEGELTFRLYGTLEGRDASDYLCRTDLTGKPLDEEVPFSEDLGYPPVLGKFFAVPDGSPFLAETGDDMTTRLSRYDAQGQIPVSIATVNDFVNALCSDTQGGLYYVGTAELKHLDLNDMTEEIVCGIAESGIKLAVNTFLLSDGDEKLAICAVGTGNSTVYLLTDQEEAPVQAETPAQTGKKEFETIRMVNMHNGMFRSISQTATSWSVSSSTYRITMENQEDPQALEALRTRTMAELMSGQGPEIMYVSEDDLHVLAETGVLMDMSELIPEDVQEQLLPGIRKLGTVDGTWVGITPSIFYYTFMTSDALWSRDSWTVSDMLDLAESKDGWGDWILSYGNAKPDYNDLFELGFYRSLGDSPFIDLENGISYFNGKDFIRTLEFCKKYGQPSNAQVDSDEVLKGMLQEGKSIAQLIYIYDGLNYFSRMMASYEDCHIVGFPSETGSGNYMYTEGYLVVNANAGHIDAIKDFIAYLLDYDVQFVSWSSVRKDVLRDQVTVHPETGKPAILHDPSDAASGWAYQVLDDLKPDGTTYLEEFMEFAESCEPVPYCPEAITEIVWEEIDAYFTGNRSAKDTADIIHRRVQLYFDER